MSFKEFCAALGIEQRFTSVAHPQTNGLPKFTNRTILRGMKNRLEGTKGNWTKELTHMVLPNYASKSHRRIPVPFMFRGKGLDTG